MFRPRQISPQERQKAIDEKGKFFAEGNCDFQILSVLERKSEAGNNMLEIGMMVWDSAGKEGNAKEFILDDERFEWKLHDFLDSIGLSDMYLEGGDFDINRMLNKSGQFTLKYKNDKKTGELRQNRTYKVPFVGDEAKEPVKKSDEPNDDIPW